MVLFQALIGIMLVWNCYCLPTGAPQEACTTFKPNHKEHVPQTSAVPYTITASGNSYSSPNDKITVTIESTKGGPAFKGFLVAAKDAQLKHLSGTWKSASGAHHIAECPAVVTHDNNNDKYKISVEWHPAADAKHGMVIMTAAVVHNFTTFWVDVPAKVVASPTAVTTAASTQAQNKTTH